jgi:hypothetical protein
LSANNKCVNPEVPFVAVFLGAQASGKSTQITKFEDKHCSCEFHVGNIMRAAKGFSDLDQ